MKTCKKCHGNLTSVTNFRTGATHYTCYNCHSDFEADGNMRTAKDYSRLIPKDFSLLSFFYAARHR